MPREETDLEASPVVDLLGGALASLTPARTRPRNYGERYTSVGVHAVNLTIGLYARDVRPVLSDFYDAHNLVEQASDCLLHVAKADDVITAKESGRVGVILGFQGLDFIGADTWQIPLLAKLGLRMATLSYNEHNQLGSGCMERNDQGLTVLGRRTVREMSRCGILLDLSHAGLRTSLDAIEVFAKPVVFSHSNAVGLTPNPRNLTDEQIKAAAASGGVVGLSPYSPFCHVTGKPRPDVEDFLNHVEYVVSLVGVDHAGVGTDFFPHSKVKWENATRRWYPEMADPYIFENLYAEGIEDHSEFGAIADGLKRRGFNAVDTGKILGGNAMRIFRAVWG